MKDFRARLRAGDQIVGTWIKTPSPIVAEVLGGSELDCLVLDAEHAPFDRQSVDGCIMAARASNMPVLVRVPTFAADAILQALDCGATGVVIPHVRTADEAAAAVRLSHYGPGGRGYAGSSRAAGYTRTSMKDHLEASARRTTVIVQIEDAEALDEIDAIAAVEGVDALFVGRIDLAVSMGASPDDPEVVKAVEAICAAGRRHGRTVGMFLSRVEDLALWRSKASLFLLQSDHGFLIAGAANLLRQARDHSR